MWCQIWATVFVVSSAITIGFSLFDKGIMNYLSDGSKPVWITNSITGILLTFIVLVPVSIIGFVISLIWLV